MNIKTFRIVSAILLLALMTAIFCLSAQEADESSSLSDGITVKIIAGLYPDFDEFSEIKQEEIIHDTTFYVRKLAHFSLYFLMGVFSFLAIVSYKRIKLFSRFLYPYTFSVLYAVSDEIHQLFVPGRSCELRDVFIDSCGILLSLVIIFVIYASSKRIKVLVS